MLAASVLTLSLLGSNSISAGDYPGQVTMIAGYDYSSGDFGQKTNTDIQFLPVTLKYDTHRWAAKIVFSYLLITGPDNIIIVGGDGTTVVGEEQRRTTSKGPGDTIASLTYKSEALFLGRTYIDLTAKIKIPTASKENRLGTGKSDFAAQVDLLHDLGPWTPFAAIGYRFLGEAANLSLTSGYFVSLGADYRLNDRWSGGAIFDYRVASSKTSDDAMELIPYATLRLTPTTSLNGYAVVGFSNGSPDRGLGIQLIYKVP